MIQDREDGDRRAGIVSLAAERSRRGLPRITPRRAMQEVFWSRDMEPELQAELDRIEAETRGRLDFQDS